MALAEATHSTPQVERDLGLVLDLLERNAQVRSFLADPRVSAEGKRDALATVLGPGIHPVLLHFVSILVVQNGLSHFRAVARRFSAKTTGLAGGEVGELMCAQPPSPVNLALIEKEMGRILGRAVRLRVRVNSSLLGGVRVQVGDFVLDGTVDRALEDFRRAL